MPSRSLTAERAARLLGELDLLAFLVDNLPDHARWNIYADWLEDRGDPRGPFLRSFLAAIQSGQNLPDSSSFPQAWRNVVGVTLIEGAIQHGLADLMGVLLGVARPTLTFSPEPSAEEDFSIGATKYSGCPDLPTVNDWPTWKGRPLGFLGQFNLADFAGTLVGRELPSSGLLSFFVFSDTAGGLPLPEPECWRVLYLPESMNLCRCPPHKDLDISNQVRPTFRVSFAETLHLPHSNSIDEVEYEQLGVGDRYDLVYCVEQMLGDRQWHLFGYGHYPTLGQAPLDGQWRHFITFDSNYRGGWDWGEWSFFFHIRETDLRNSRFDATQVIVN